MKDNLLPYQSALLDELLSTSNSNVVVSAPPGVGVSTVLVHFVASFEERPVVVVVPRRELLEQWSIRLATEGVQEIEELRQSSEVLLGLERADDAPRSTPRVVLSTTQAIRQGAGRKYADQLRPALLIVDLPASLTANVDSDRTTGFEELAADLASRSQRVVVRTNVPRNVSWLDSPQQLTISLREALSQRSSQARIAIVRYNVSAEEHQLFEQVGGLLEETDAGRLAASTRPAMYGTLTRLAARLSDEIPLEGRGFDSAVPAQNRLGPASDLLERAWGLIEGLERLGDDARLSVLLRLVEESIAQDRPVLITTVRVDETEYVATRLREAGVDVGSLSGSMDFSERHRIADRFGPGVALVASRATLETFVRPVGTAEIWWSPPRTFVDAAQRVTSAGDHGRLVALIAEPPTMDDQRLLALLAQLEAETGVGIDPILDR